MFDVRLIMYDMHDRVQTIYKLIGRRFLRMKDKQLT